MLRRRTFLAGVLVAGAVALSASIPATAQQTFHIGILIPGSISDKGWMESGYDGLLASQEKYGGQIEVQMIENIADADMVQAITQLAIGNQLVIGVGGQTQAAIYDVAQRFPNVSFSIVGGNAGQEAANVAGYDVKQAEVAFLAGAAAAMLSQTGVASYVGGLEIPSIVNAGTEFANGAHYINPDMNVIVNFTGDFDDVAGSKEATLAAIAQGADIHYHILNLGLRGMEQAATEQGTHIIGGYTARCGTDPLYIAYSVTGVGYQVQYAIDQFVAGTWEPGYVAFGLQKGPEASDMIVCSSTPEIDAKLQEIKEKILSGEITVLEG
jgi:basic membrane protein A and related proteins